MDNTTFEPESLSLIKLFKSTEVFSIPEYQRPYSWEKDQVNKLWEDIFEGFENSLEGNSAPYFLGSIIVIDKKNGISDIVDGQQRITTLTILLDVLNKMNPELNKEKDSRSNPLIINNRKLESCIHNDNDNSRLRLQSKPGFCTDFELAIIDNRTYDDYIEKKCDANTSVKDRFINTAAILYKYIKELIDKGYDIGDFVNYVCNNVFVIKITCNSVGFAIKLFQVLNSRGLDLAPADVIKGYLMDDSRLPAESYGRFIFDWNESEKKISSIDNETISSIFTYYLYYLLGKSPKKTLVEEFENIIKHKYTDLGDVEKNETKDSASILKNIKNFTEIFDNIDNADDEVTVSFFYMPWRTFWATCLLTAKHLKYRDYDRYAKEVRRFFYVSYICGLSLNQLKKPLLEIINAVKLNMDFNIISNICRKALEDKDYESKLKYNLGQKNVYGESWVKPVLLLINNNLDDNPSINKVLIDSNLHVEHILPQKHIGTDGWSHMSVNGEEVINSLGNLTLLGYKKNIKAKNSCFTDKLQIYNGNDSSGKFTCYNITRNLEGFTLNNCWNETSISDRHEYLMGKLGDILDIDCLKK